MDELARLAEQLQSIGQAITDQAEMPRPVAVAKSSTSTSSQGGGSGNSILSDVLDFTGIGFGVAPLISGIASLFGGGDSTAPPPLVKFAMPQSLNIDAGVREAAPTAAFGVDNAQGGTPRGVASPQVTVQVQAMDSQSFLDRSADIAAAVRQAMLTSGVLNDVIREV